jgi:hypothetical protein
MNVKPKTIRLGDLRYHLSLYDDDYELFFGAGNLDFYRTKTRGAKLVQIEFCQDTSCIADVEESESDSLTVQ